MHWVMCSTNTILTNCQAKNLQTYSAFMFTEKIFKIIPSHRMKTCSSSGYTSYSYANVILHTDIITTTRLNRLCISPLSNK